MLQVPQIKNPSRKAGVFDAFGEVGRTRRDYSRRCRSPRWGRRRFALALSRACALGSN